MLSTGRNALFFQFSVFESTHLHLTAFGRLYQELVDVAQDAVWDDFVVSIHSDTARELNRTDTSITRRLFHHLHTDNEKWLDT